MEYEESRELLLPNDNGETGQKKSSKRALVLLGLCQLLLVAIPVAVVVAVFSGSHETASPSPSDPPSVDPFGWKACPDNLDFPLFQCGTLQVPLDHLNKSSSNSPKIGIAVIKLTSSALVKKGTILVNPGGPGGSGLNLVAKAGLLIKTITGGEYDILGFDPRGVGQSRSVLCFENSALHSANNIMRMTVGSPGGLDDSITVSKYDALVRMTAEGCGRWSHDLLPYISTAYTARDMDEIREALKEPVLNYWGFSYGTFLGITYVNMFPDRVGRVTIDGVTDPTTYSHNFLKWSWSVFTNTQDVIDGFSRLCFEAGPSVCPLTKPNDNEFSVIQRIRSFIYAMANAPVPAVADSGAPVLVTADDIASLVFSSTYTPDRWPVYASAFAKAIFYKDFTEIATFLDMGTDRDKFCPVKDESSNMAFWSIKCNDGWKDDEISMEEFEEGSEIANEMSEFGGRSWVWEGVGCKYWPAKAVERYGGPWNKALKNKVLILGNTYDPVTPLESAQLAEELMQGNGVLLTHNGFGHCSIAQPSRCTMDHIRNYYNTGTLPPKGTVCNVEKGANPFIKTGLDAFTADAEWQAMSEEIFKANKRN